MTGYAINAKSEALDLRGLSSEELDAVSGGSWFLAFAEQLYAASTFSKALQDAGSV